MSLALNQQLFEYRVVRVLGQGGFGTVYLAHDTLLDRPVAIKELTITAQTDEVAFKRFIQEARVAGGLNHPHIVTVYALKVVGPNVYLVMEYLAGGSLRALLEQRGSLAVEQAVHIAADVCEGLAAAHAQDIVHRDVKPENILLTEDGRAKVGDFGIAHVPRGKGGTYLSGLTTTGFQPETMPSRLRGRPAGCWGLMATGLQPEMMLYMSPEQIQGQQVDGRSDVYQAGALLYEMLTGRHYVDMDALRQHARETAGSNAILFQALLLEMLTEVICEWELVEMCEVLPDAPGWVGKAVTAALMKAMKKRPTAEALARALRSGEGVHVAPSISSGAARVTLAQEHFERGVAHHNQGHLDEAIREYQAALRINPDFAEAHLNLGMAYGQQGRPDEAIREYQAALRINPYDAMAHYNLGVAYRQQSRPDDEIREYQAALRINPDFAEAHYNLGLVYGQQGRLDDAIREFQFALRISPGSAKAHYILGLAYEQQGRLDEAIREYQAALHINPDYANRSEEHTSELQALS